MKTEIRRKAKNDFEKYFFKLMNNAVSGKIMKNIRKHRDIKPVHQKKEESFQYQNQIIVLPSFSLDFDHKRKNTIIHKQTYLFGTINTRTK